jgi:hypothetical protein
MKKIKEFFRKIFKKTEEEKRMSKWSLKKKLILVGGVVATTVLGIFAFGRNRENDIYEDEDDFDEFDQDFETEEDLNVTEEEEIFEKENVTEE